MNTISKPLLILSFLFIFVSPFESTANHLLEKAAVNEPAPKKVAPVNFYFPKNVYHFKVKDDTKAYYQNLLAYLNEHSDKKIFLTGYAHDGSKKYWNNEVSKYRANKVRDSLVDAGFKRSQIVIDYKGKSAPLAKDDTEQELAKNRRVELRVK